LKSKVAVLYPDITPRTVLARVAKELPIAKET
jgi:hypothetical protein